MKKLLKSVVGGLQAGGAYIRFPGLNKEYYVDEKYSLDTINTAIERVNRGMANLDKRVPNWVNKINLPDLKMSDGCFCVVGQTCNGYTGKKVAFIDTLDGQVGKIDELTELENLTDSPYKTIALAAQEKLDELEDEIRASEINNGFMSSEAYDDNVDFALLDIIWVSALRERQRTGKQTFLAPQTTAF